MIRSSATDEKNIRNIIGSLFLAVAGKAQTDTTFKLIKVI
jgi:hypothetical protein